MEEEPLPCPFCGGVARERRTNERAGYSGARQVCWRVGCVENPNCAIDGPLRFEKANAIEAWNKALRPTPATGEQSPAEDEDGGITLYTPPPIPSWWGQKGSKLTQAERDERMQCASRMIKRGDSLQKLADMLGCRTTEVSLRIFAFRKKRPDLFPKLNREYGSAHNNP